MESIEKLMENFITWLIRIFALLQQYAEENKLNSLLSAYPKNGSIVNGRFNQHFELMRSEVNKPAGNARKVGEKNGNNTFAVKIVKYDKKEMGIAISKVEKLLKLRHENILQYLPCWIEEDQDCKSLYILTAYTPSLFDWYNEQNKIEKDNRKKFAVDCLKQLSSAMEYCHQNKIIHGDLKAENICIANAERNKRNKIERIDLVIGDFALLDGTEVCQNPEQEELLMADDVLKMGNLFGDFLNHVENLQITSNMDSDNELRKKVSDEEFYYLIKKMVEVTPKERPTFEEILKRMKRKRKMHQQFHVIRKLGSGVYGSVYLANKRSKNTSEEARNNEENAYAVKIIRYNKDSDNLQFVYQEARTLVDLDHPNILRYYDSWTDEPFDGFNLNKEFWEKDGKIANKREKEWKNNPDYEEVHLYIQTQYCANTLENWLQEKHPNLINSEEYLFRAKDMFRQICEGMKYVHSKKIFHGDLKGANIFVRVEENSHQAVVGDFGFALGTPLYQSPEQKEISSNNMKVDALNKLKAEGTYVDPSKFEELNEKIKSGLADLRTATDVYSMGLVYCEMLTVLQHNSNKMKRNGLLNKVRSKEYSPEIPEEEWELIMKMTENEPGERTTFKEILDSSYFQ